MTMSSSTQSSAHSRQRTLGELKRIPDFDPRGASRSVKDELRRNLLRAIEKGETLFPGVHGYDDTVVPQIDRKSTRLNSSHLVISYAVFCLKKKHIRRATTIQARLSE